MDGSTNENEKVQNYENTDYDLSVETIPYPFFQIQNFITEDTRFDKPHYVIENGLPVRVPVVFIVAVYTVVCKYRNNETWECWPSAVLISKKLQIHRAMAGRALKVLEEMGYIKVIGKAGRANKYEIVKHYKAKTVRTNRRILPFRKSASNE